MDGRLNRFQTYCTLNKKECLPALNEIFITGVRVIDLRFPTSREHIGSDAVNKDPDYSAAYCILETNSGLQGYGLTFTLGRGTDLVVQAARHLSRYIANR